MNRSVEKKLYRDRIAKETGRCAICPPHRGENRERTPKKSWKFRTRTEKQYKPEGGRK